MYTFRNIRDDGILPVLDSDQRETLIPTQGFVVLQLSDYTLWSGTGSGWEQISGGGGGGGIAIGDEVSGGSLNCVLYVNPVGNLANSTNFQFSTTPLYGSLTLNGSVTFGSVAEAAPYSLINLDAFGGLTYSSEINLESETITRPNEFSTIANTAGATDVEAVGYTFRLDVNNEDNYPNANYTAVNNKLEIQNNGEFFAAIGTNNAIELDGNANGGIIGATFSNAQKIGEGTLSIGVVANAARAVDESSGNSPVFGYYIFDLQGNGDRFGFYNDVSGSANRFTRTNFQENISDNFDQYELNVTDLRISNTGPDSNAVIKSALVGNLYIEDNEDHLNEILLGGGSNIHHSGDGTVEFAVGNAGATYNDNNGTINNAIGVVGIVDNTSGGTIENAYAFYVYQLGDATNRYSFYTAMDAISFFGGETRFGGTDPETAPNIFSSSGNINFSALQSFEDDTAAGLGGLISGDLYKTTGTGAAPLNAPGILMVKQ